MQRCRWFDECKRKRNNDGIKTLAEKHQSGLRCSHFTNDFWPHRLARPRTSDFHSANRGSNPLGVNLKETLAQSVEHLTFNERVDGSSPSSLKLKHSRKLECFFYSVNFCFLDTIFKIWIISYALL